jgi:hypothetical protein
MYFIPRHFIQFAEQVCYHADVSFRGSAVYYWHNLEPPKHTTRDVAVYYANRLQIRADYRIFGELETEFLHSAANFFAAPERA